MNSRKKLIISLSSLGLAIVAAIGITFGVLAAQTQTVSNTFTVSYRANNVSAVAFVKYKLENSSNGVYTYFVNQDANAQSVTVKTENKYTEAEINAMPDADIERLYAYHIPTGEATSVADKKSALLASNIISANPGTQSVGAVQFSADQASGSGTLAVDANSNTIALGNNTVEETDYFDHYVIIAYGFTNTANYGGENMYVTLTDNSILHTQTYNVEVYYFVSSSYSETAENIMGSNGANKHLANTAKTMYTGAIRPQETKFVYVLVKIDNTTLGANYASGIETISNVDVNHGVTWLLSNENPEA